MPSKSTSLVVPRPFFFSAYYHHNIHMLDLRRPHSFFLALDFFYREHVFCIWLDTSRRKEYHQMCPWNKYNSCFLASLVTVHNPLMVRFMPPTLFEHA